MSRFHVVLTKVYGSTLVFRVFFAHELGCFSRVFAGGFQSETFFLVQGVAQAIRRGAVRCGVVERRVGLIIRHIPQRGRVFHPHSVEGVGADAISVGSMLAMDATQVPGMRAFHHSFER